jgi:AraC family transcriptional activator FtrA
MGHLVAILAYDQLCTFEFGCAVELFALHRPELGIAWYDHAVCAAEPGPLRAMGGLKVQAPYGLGKLRRADTIVVPGWRNADETPPARLLSAIRAAHARGARVASICSGVFVLAHAGLLQGRRVTTHWRYAQKLADRFPDLQVDASALYVDEGSVITSAGSAAGLDMLIHLVRSDHGTKVANQVAQRLVLPPHRDGGQAQFVPRPLPHSDGSPIARLIDLMRENPRATHTLDTLASHAGLGVRTLQRQFKQSTGQTPLEWLTRERIAIARELVEEHPSLSIDDVADLAGFGSPESLRRHFRLRGLPAPSRLRRQLSGAESARLRAGA